MTTNDTDEELANGTHWLIGYVKCLFGDHDWEKTDYPVYRWVPAEIAKKFDRCTRCGRWGVDKQ